MQRSCQQQWFSTFHFLSYSQQQDGLYCLPCVLFTVKSEKYKRTSNLIDKPFTYWKDVTSDFKSHCTSEYHKNAEIKLISFMEVMEKKSTSIDVSINTKLKD